MSQITIRPYGPFRRALYGIHDAIVRSCAYSKAQSVLRREGYRIDHAEFMPSHPDGFAGMPCMVVIPVSYKTPAGESIDPQTYAQIVADRAARIARPNLWLLTPPR